MHGIIHAEFKCFLTSKLGKYGWDELVAASGIQQKAYLASQTYPDEEIGKLVGSASQRLGQPATALLEEFGAFIVPGLVTTYKPLIKPQWRTLDLIEHTEHTIHRVVRLKDPAAAPPVLTVSRTNSDEVVITYASPRRLCAVAKGIVGGVARHYNEAVHIAEPACMLTGAKACIIVVRSAGQ